jgi:sortase A
MGKITLVLAIIFFSFLGTVFAVQTRNNENKIIPEVISVTPTPSETARIIGIPKRLLIPKTKVDSPIEEVGLDKEGRMDVPKNVYNVGWYKFGPKPGEEGSAALDGHLDTPTGDPSVFFNLTKLVAGDELKILDERGKELTFKVIEGRLYELSDFPKEQIFNKTGGKYLNLITCAGEWDKNSKNYSQRYVVFAELQ